MRQNEYIVKETLVMDTLEPIRFKSNKELVGQIVRCRDCKYKTGRTCDYSAVYVHPNGYCHWGERKDDE